MPKTDNFICAPIFHLFASSQKRAQKRFFSNRVFHGSLIVFEVRKSMRIEPTEAQPSSYPDPTLESRMSSNPTTDPSQCRT